MALGITVELELGPWRDGVRALRRALNHEVERALGSIGRSLKSEARSSHSYQDRTGYLTRSIDRIPTAGSFTRDTLEGGVVATASYASFVEDGTTRARAYQYLGAAWDLRREESEQRLGDAVEAAVRSSGLL